MALEEMGRWAGREGLKMGCPVSHSLLYLIGIPKQKYSHQSHAAHSMFYIVLLTILRRLGHVESQAQDFLC